MSSDDTANSTAVMVSNLEVDFDETDKRRDTCSETVLLCEI